MSSHSGDDASPATDLTSGYGVLSDAQMLGRYGDASDDDDSTPDLVSAASSSSAWETASEASNATAGSIPGLVDGSDSSSDDSDRTTLGARTRSWSSMEGSEASDASAASEASEASEASDGDDSDASHGGPSRQSYEETQALVCFEFAEEMASSGPFAVDDVAFARCFYDSVTTVVEANRGNWAWVDSPWFALSTPFLACVGSPLWATFDFAERSRRVRLARLALVATAARRVAEGSDPDESWSIRWGDVAAALVADASVDDEATLWNVALRVRRYVLASQHRNMFCNHRLFVVANVGDEEPVPSFDVASRYVAGRAAPRGGEGPLRGATAVAAWKLGFALAVAAAARDGGEPRPVFVGAYPWPAFVSWPAVLGAVAALASTAGPRGPRSAPAAARKNFVAACDRAAWTVGVQVWAAAAAARFRTWASEGGGNLGLAPALRPGLYGGVAYHGLAALQFLAAFAYLVDYERWWVLGSACLKFCARARRDAPRVAAGSHEYLTMASALEMHDETCVAGGDALASGCRKPCHRHAHRAAAFCAAYAASAGVFDVAASTSPLVPAAALLFSSFPCCGSSLAFRVGALFYTGVFAEIDAVATVLRLDAAAGACGDAAAPAAFLLMVSAVAAAYWACVARWPAFVAVFVVKALLAPPYDDAVPSPAEPPAVAWLRRFAARADGRLGRGPGPPARRLRAAVDFALPPGSVANTRIGCAFQTQACGGFGLARAGLAALLRSLAWLLRCLAALAAVALRAPSALRAATREVWLLLAAAAAAGWAAAARRSAAAVRAAERRARTAASQADGARRAEVAAARARGDAATARADAADRAAAAAAARLRRVAAARDAAEAAGRDARAALVAAELVVAEARAADAGVDAAARDGRHLGAAARIAALADERDALRARLAPARARGDVEPALRGALEARGLGHVADAFAAEGIVDAATAALLEDGEFARFGLLSLGAGAGPVASIRAAIRASRPAGPAAAAAPGDAPEDLLCPITHELFRDPVFLADGHVYERSAIERWFASGKRVSPLTNAPVSEALAPAHAVKAMAARHAGAAPAPRAARDAPRPANPFSGRSVGEHLANRVVGGRAAARSESPAGLALLARAAPQAPPGQAAPAGVALGLLQQLEQLPPDQRHALLQAAMNHQTATTQTPSRRRHEPPDPFEAPEAS